MRLILHSKHFGTWRPNPIRLHRKPADSKPRLNSKQRFWTHRQMQRTKHTNSPTSLSVTDPLEILERIAHWPANSNSDPDQMAEALDSIQQLANDALESLRSLAPVAGTNKELAELLISAASALNHGRYATASTKVAAVYKALHSDNDGAIVLSHHRPILPGADSFGPFLMFADFRSAMPSTQAAHVISHLINKGRSYCGQPDCPCGPVDPPHDHIV